MPLETASTIADLVSTNPVGASDTPAALDDHIRLIKTVLKADALVDADIGVTIPALSHTHTSAQVSGLVTESGLTQSTAKLLGRTTAGTGVVEEISVSGATLSGGTLTVPTTSFASSAENSAGTIENKSVDPLGIREAFNATGTAPVYACRAWINFNGTGTPTARGSGNVLSITDNGTGDYTINFTTAMPDANYAVIATTRYQTESSATQCETFPIDASSCRIKSTDLNGNPFDSEYISVAVFR